MVENVSGERGEWSTHSPDEIVRRTRCMADETRDAVVWRDCCDLILERLEQGPDLSRISEENAALRAERDRLKDLAEGACFHFFACASGPHIEDECGQLIPSMADLAKAIGFQSDPATDGEIQAVSTSSAERNRQALTPSEEPPHGR